MKASSSSAIGPLGVARGRRFALPGSLAREVLAHARRRRRGRLQRFLTPAGQASCPSCASGRCCSRRSSRTTSILGVLAVTRDIGAPPFSARESHRLRVISDYAALALWKAESLEQAQAADRAKSRFLATVSHELRTPLTALAGYEELLVDQVIGPLSDSQLDVLERMRSVTQHLASVIEEVLAFSSLDEGREIVRPTDFLAADLRARGGGDHRAAGAAEASRASASTTPDAAIRMTSDIDKIRQILVNLAGNAVKFTDEGEVRLELQRRERRRVLHRPRHRHRHRAARPRAPVPPVRPARHGPHAPPWRHRTRALHLRADWPSCSAAGSRSTSEAGQGLGVHARAAGTTRRRPTTRFGCHGLALDFGIMSSLPITSVFNDGYIAEVYESFRRDPASVDESWRQFFRIAEQLGRSASVGADGGGVRRLASCERPRPRPRSSAPFSGYGHLAVQLDPLGTPPPGAAELKPEFHGITEADLRQFRRRRSASTTSGTAADVVQQMRDVYCGAIALRVRASRRRGRAGVVPHDHRVGRPRPRRSPTTRSARCSSASPRSMDSSASSAWRTSASSASRSKASTRSCRCSTKRSRAARRPACARRSSAWRIAAGSTCSRTSWASRIARCSRSSRAVIPTTNAESDTGDVKYHKGYRGTRDVPGAGSVAIELVPNPEPPRGRESGGRRRRARAPARAGRGAEHARRAERAADRRARRLVVSRAKASLPETLNMSLLRGYRVGGTLHIIANNQVGFTTDPIDARSTHYASDLAKGFEIPIVHVNGDDAEACLQAVRLGIAYRQRFNKDFLIDLVGLPPARPQRGRSAGVHAADDVQDRSAEHPTPREIFGARLVRERVVTEDDVKAADKALSDQLQRASTRR